MSSRRLSLVVGCLLFALSCGPPEPTGKQPPRVFLVSPKALHGSPGIYSGQHVRVELRATRYTVTGGEIHWHTNRMTDPPAVVFVVASPPADNSRSLEVVGVCRGRIEDNRPRGDFTNYYVRVEVLSLSVVPDPRPEAP